MDDGIDEMMNEMERRCVYSVHGYKRGVMQSVMV